LPTLRST